MNTFLEFLNTADAAEIRKLSGIGDVLAERIVAARPFSSLEDCQRVKGLGEKLLQNLRDSFEGTASMTEQTDLVPASGQSSPESEPKVTATAAAAKPNVTFGQRLGRIFRGFLKFIMVLLVLVLIFGAIGAGLYFGLPYLHQAYVVPVNQNTARIAAVAHQQARDTLALREEISILKTQLARQQEQNSQVETRLAALETSIEAHTATLARLEELQSTLDEAASQQREGLSAELSRQVRLTRAIELLSRARLYLSQSNFGQAREDVLLARDLLVALRDDLPEEDQPGMDSALFRLNLAIDNLPGFPVIAADDLNIAWNLLVLDFSEQNPPATP